MRLDWASLTALSSRSHTTPGDAHRTDTSVARSRAGCSRGKASLRLLLSALSIGVALTPRIAAAQAPPYTFTQIKAINDPANTPVTCVGMNNLGTVVASIGQGVWRGGVGQTSTRIATDGSGLCPSINDLNEVAYVSDIGLIRQPSNGSPTILATSAAFPFLASGRTYLPSIASDGSALLPR